KKYTEEHEWIDIDNGIATIGITDHAQGSLGEIVYVQSADLKDVEKGDTIGSVESVKAASDIYAPVSGKVIEVNEDVAANPSLLNDNPEGEGWLCKIQLSSDADVSNLLSEEAYKKLVEAQH
ncbi:hypothetical protein BX616_001959, partial [Lobosporangium transversale]